MESEKRRGRPKGSKDKKPRVINPDTAPWKKSPLINPTLGVDVQEGDNRKAIQFGMEFFDLERVDMKNTPQVEERVKYYFEKCAEWDVKPGVAGLSFALGYDRRTLYSMMSEVRGTSMPESVVLIKKIYNYLENLWETNFQNGKINPVVGIFLGKNHFAYRDQVEHVMGPQNDDQAALDPGEIAKRLSATIDHEE